MKTQTSEIVETVQFYIERYPERTTDLLAMVLNYAAEKLESEAIQEAVDNLDDTCQRICNPSDYTDEENDPIDWSEYM
jgi:hypothetical protein